MSHRDEIRKKNVRNVDIKSVFGEVYIVYLFTCKWLSLYILCFMDYAVCHNLLERIELSIGYSYTSLTT